jgi:hypothetical protein
VDEADVTFWGYCPDCRQGSKGGIAHD